MVEKMRAYLLHGIGEILPDAQPLQLQSVCRPVPGPGEILIRVMACGVCHTELDEIEGRTPPPSLPVVPGHQVVGEVVESGPGAVDFGSGERVGVAWYYDSCGSCGYCLSGRENICPAFVGTGRDRDGGYAEYMTVPEKSAYAIPERLGAASAAPLLCGGAIGYRSLMLTGMRNGDTLGLSGFGASAHIVIQLVKALYPNSRVVVFARREEQQCFARELGADWAGGFAEKPPYEPQAIIDTTPAWSPVLSSLKVLARGGRLVINAIRKESGDVNVLQSLDYAEHLWLEKEIKSVANITRHDVQEFLELAGRLNIRPEVTEYPFTEANAALIDLKFGRNTGAKVLVMTREEIQAVEDDVE